MPEAVAPPDDATVDASLASSFRRYGHIGFWVQILVAGIPILVAALVMVLNQGGGLPGGRFTVIGFLGLVSLLILCFTTYWCRRYVQVAQHIEDEDESWTRQAVTRTVGIGLAASSIGILLSTVVMVVEVAYLLVIFLEAPQGGVPVIQTSADVASWISAVDVLSLFALTLIMAAEIIVLVSSLWLLYRVATAGFERADEPAPQPVN